MDKGRSDDSKDLTDASCASCGEPIDSPENTYCAECLEDVPTIGHDSPPHGEFTPSKQPGTPSSIETIGSYILRSKLGTGGMGTVFLAEQSKPVKRMVAMKLLRDGFDSAELLSRFEAERQALAMMEHPNIAHVYDAGTTDDGRPYFVMEWVKGVPVNDYCDQHQLEISQRIELFLHICSGVQHAHEKGIIHRDLKPTNILITEIEGKPVPKIIDFGVAKALGDPLSRESVATLDGQMMGTPQYMSPEQAEGRNSDIDVRSDVFSLGIILYELLTGSTPISPKEFREAGLIAMGKLIRETPPTRPSTKISSLGERGSTVATFRSTEPARLQRELKSDLDWIVLRALAPERRMRYSGAGHLSDDLNRHLRDEPVEASPPSARYRITKFARRHKAFFGGAVAVSAALILGIIASTWQAYRATRSEKIARIQEQSARARNLVDTDAREALRSITDAADRDREIHGGSLSVSVLSDLLHVLHKARETTRFSISENDFVAVSENGRFLATGESGRLQIWDQPNNIHRKLNLLPQGERITSLQFFDSHLFAGGYSGAIYRISPESNEIIWSVKAHQSSIVSATIRIRETPFLVSAGSDGTIRFWNLDGTRQEDSEIDFSDQLQSIDQIAISRDGTRFVAINDPLTGESLICMGELNSKSSRILKTPSSQSLSMVSFEPDGEHFLTVSKEGTVLRWDWKGFTASSFSVRRPENLVSMIVHPTMPLAFFGYSDGEIHVRNFEGGNAMPPLTGHIAGVMDLSFSASGSRLYSVSTDNTTRSWDILGLQAFPPLPIGEKTESVLFSPDGQYLAAGCISGRVRVFDIEKREEIMTDLQMEASCEALRAIPGRNQYVALNYLGGEVAFLEWPATEWAPRMLLPGNRAVGLAVHPEGHECVTIGSDQNGPYLYQIDLTSSPPQGKRVKVPDTFQLEQHSHLVYSSDGQFLVIRSSSELISLTWGQETVPEVVATRFGVAGSGTQNFGMQKLSHSDEILFGSTTRNGVAGVEIATIPSFEQKTGFVAPYRELDVVVIGKNDDLIGLITRKAEFIIHDYSGIPLGPALRANHWEARVRSHAWHPKEDIFCLPSLGTSLRFWSFGRDDWLALARNRSAQSSGRSFENAVRDRQWKVLPQEKESVKSETEDSSLSLGIPGVSIPMPEGWTTMDPAIVTLFSRIGNSFLGDDSNRGKIQGGLSGPPDGKEGIWERPALVYAYTDEFQGESVLDAISRMVGLFRGRASSLERNSSLITDTQFLAPEWNPDLNMLQGSLSIVLGATPIQMRYYALPTKSRLLMFVALGGEDTWPTIESTFRALTIPDDLRMPESFNRSAPALLEEISTTVSNKGIASQKAREFATVTKKIDAAASDGLPEEAAKWGEEALALAEPYGISGEKIPAWVNRENAMVMRLARFPDPRAEERKARLESHIEKLAGFSNENWFANETIQRFLIDGFEALASWKDEQGATAMALTYNEKAIAVVERLYEQTNNVELVDRLGNLYRNRSIFLQKQGEPGNAILVLRDGIDRLHQLPARMRSAQWVRKVSDLYDQMWHASRSLEEVSTRRSVSEEWLTFADTHTLGPEGSFNRNLQWELYRAKTRVADGLNHSTEDARNRVVQLRSEAIEIAFKVDQDSPLTAGSRNDVKGVSTKLSDLLSMRADDLSKKAQFADAAADFETALKYAKIALQWNDDLQALGTLVNCLTRRTSHWMRCKEYQMEVLDREQITATREQMFQKQFSLNRRLDLLRSKLDLASAFRRAEDLESANREISLLLKSLQNTLAQESKEQVRIARLLGSSFHTAKEIARAQKQSAKADEFVRARQQIASRYLEKAGDRESAIQFFWAQSDWVNLLKSTKTGSVEKWVEESRRALDAVEPYRSEIPPSGNTGRVITGMEKFISNHTATGNPEE